MVGNRKAAEAVLLKRIESLGPGGPTPQIYRDMFAKMDDNAFHAFMMRIKNREVRPAYLAPNKGTAPLSVQTALNVAKDMGHSFYQRIWITPSDGKRPAYLTNKAYLVLDLPYRRQAQLLEKKIRIPKHNRSIDDLTGQPSGESKGSKLSSPEVQVMAALDLPNMLIEYLKYRGGDVKGYDAMIDMIDKTGSVAMKSIEHLAGGVESTRTFSTILTCMHLQNSLR